MRYAFLIDQDTCIGCHACTVACKAEHDVPLGVNRTWVKYIEKGTFPHARRYFSVNRCNHCADAPCVRICPTAALYSRADGIVDFDDSRCIGCKSCLNACPYDALYINPDTQTAHKCNFCTHRLEVGLEPSCVIVCPTQSIVAGDIADPGSRISLLLGRHDTKVRAPEQNTKPHVFYKGADEAALDPLRTAIAPDGLIWADTTKHHPTPPGDGDDAHIVARTTYTTPHPMPWKGKVSAYLVTKAVSAGALLVGALAVLTGYSDERAFVGIALPVIALVFAAITGALLVADLRQPKRFHYIFLKPQWGSWLVRGAFILLAYGLLAVLWLVAGVADAPGMLEVLAAPTALLAAGTAGYTAYLFAQCEGRDLWQSPLLLPVLLAQAGAAGAGAALVIAPWFDLPDGLGTALRWALVGSVMAFGLVLVAELTSRGTRHVELAQDELTEGAHRHRFWAGLLAVSAAVVAELVGGGVVAGILVLAGLALYEDAFVRAGQAVPLS